MSSTFIRTGVAALGATIALGGVAWGASSMSTASAETPAVTKRIDGNDALVLVADDDDDDDGARKADDTNTRSKASRSRVSRGTLHSRNSGRSRDRTNSRKTKVSRDRDRSRADKTRDWTRDGGDRTRDRSANRTNDRSKNDTRWRRG
ncbi:hypothetical protein FE697_016670 [Mumia zhuanghuii]|uniref:Uncharacterized protein n=2 Tax=Mumia TaxID=1546255 RepID=A0ABW1QSA5_9ACTN|nr:MULTISPECIES: hypothetical protein [Mumia]KAA1420584.1 hypothetical protein FE697_016670 [Mumia zhuanghuii]